MCVAGARVLLSRNAAGGATKTAFAIQLVASEGCWIGAHPSLGNRLAAAALRRGLLAAALGPHVSARAEVTHGRMRVDFELADAAGGRTLVEVKNVVCSDYAKGSKAPRPKGYELIYSPHCGADYRRAAIFPVGKIGQKLEDGTRVVSERAIKHVAELAALSADSSGAVKARIYAQRCRLCVRLLDCCTYNARSWCGRLRCCSWSIVGTAAASACAAAHAPRWRRRRRGRRRAASHSTPSECGGAAARRTSTALCRLTCDDAERCTLQPCSRPP